MAGKVYGCSDWRRAGETRQTSADVVKALLGSSAAWHRGAPRHLEGRVLSWEGRRGTHLAAGSSASCAPGTTTVTHLCCFPLHHCDPGKSVDLSWTHTQDHHTPSPMSVQDANTAGAYRQIVTYLPGLTFPRQDTAWRMTPGKDGEESLGWSGNGG